MARWQIPEPIGADFKLRAVDTATITVRTLDDGRFQQVVEHAPLPDVTPAMCLWYLEHVDTQITWRGLTALGYRFWHPRDHIYFKRHGAFGPGDRWHIVEAFGADRRFLLDRTFHVTELGDAGFTMELRQAGQTVALMSERWQPGDAGLRWTVEMTVGSTTPGLRRISRAITRRQLPFLERWRQHNVEEAGCLPQFLPELYAGRAS